MVGEFLPLAVPVDFKRGRTYNETGEGIGHGNGTDGLERLAKARLVPDDEALVLESVFDALLLIGVWCNFQVVAHDCICFFRAL